MRLGTTPTAFASLVLVSALALAGCASDDSGDGNGIEDLEPDEILEQVSEAVDNATSVHLVGEQTEGEATVGLDLRKLALPRLFLPIGMAGGIILICGVIETVNNIRLYGVGA